MTMDKNVSEIFSDQINETDIFNLIYKYRVVGATSWIFIVILGLLGNSNSLFFATYNRSDM
jgi:hypothetical protein